MKPCCFLLLSLAGALAAQSIDVYSEFQRVDPYGEIVAADRSAEPREILSPALVRNAWASFHVAVHSPVNDSYLLYVATNPLDACRVALYKEHFVKTPSGWIPDRLTELHRLPDYGFMPDPDDGVPGQNTRVYLLALWIPPDSQVGRFRLEIQLKTGVWTVQPMELRVFEARVPELPAAAGQLSLPPIESPADAAAAGPLADYLAGRPLRAESEPSTVRAIIRRDAIQDLALARQVTTTEALRDLWAAFACPRVLGAEWWLRLRDSVFASGQKSHRGVAEDRRKAMRFLSVLRSSASLR